MSKDRIDLTQFEGISPAKGWGLVYPEWPQRTSLRTGDALYFPHCHADDIEVRRANMALMAAAPDLLAELKICYRIIDILQDSEDFDTQVAFHEEGLCKYLKYPCGPCESSEEE